MKTDELIKGIAADAATTPMPMGRAWWAALLAGVAIAAVTFFVLLGLRPDFSTAMETARFILKFVLSGILGVTAWFAIRALSMPGQIRRGVMLALLIAPVLLVIAAFTDMMILPEGERMARMIGKNNMLCLLAIPAIGLLPLGIFLAALRHGAPSDPGRAGMVAGLLAGGVAAFFYGAHCTDDSPLFVVVWYTLAIAILAGIGALVGRKVLRW